MVDKKIVQHNKVCPTYEPVNNFLRPLKAPDFGAFCNVQEKIHETLMIPLSLLMHIIDNIAFMVMPKGVIIFGDGLDSGKLLTL